MFQKFFQICSQLSFLISILHYKWAEDKHKFQINNKHLKNVFLLTTWFFIFEFIDGSRNNFALPVSIMVISF